MVLDHMFFIILFSMACPHNLRTFLLILFLRSLVPKGLGTSYNIVFSTIHYVISILALMEEDLDYLEDSLI